MTRSIAAILAAFFCVLFAPALSGCSNADNSAVVGEWTPSSSWDGNYWAMLPQRIREAEIFKQNVHPLPDQGIGAKEVEYMKAECDALIAYYYWLMVNTYGAIPFTPGKVYTTDATEEEMMQGQKVVKAFCHEEESIKKFNELNDELYDSASKANP